jgi:hypothetical protein
VELKHEVFVFDWSLALHSSSSFLLLHSSDAAFFLGQLVLHYGI